MIQANELRIGNWVLINNNTYQVDVIDYNQIIATEKGLIELKYVDPIPLNEEWLIKFGFGRNSNRTLNILVNNLLLEYDLDYKSFDFLSFGYTLSLRANIEYVHQLQNLYFALTGEELKIK